MKSQMIFLDSMSHMEGNWCEKKIILLIAKMRYAIIANPASGKKHCSEALWVNSGCNCTTQCLVVDFMWCLVVEAERKVYKALKTSLPNN